MKITQKDWNNYISTLSKVNDKAAKMITDYIEKNGIDDRKALLDYTVNVVQTMSQASASYAADWYDAIAKLQKKFFADAEMADLPTYGEIARTVNGILKRTLNTEAIASAASALTKRAAADTTLKNAKRDGAEFAWIPVGDTCAYCLELASFGWRTATDQVLKGNHAEHIHANCDCEFAIRFGNDLSYASYDPDKYKEMFDNADGKTLDEKRNSIRRMQYQENKDRINAQKREAYAEKKQEEEPKTLEKNITIDDFQNIKTIVENNDKLDIDSKVLDTIYSALDDNNALYKYSDVVLEKIDGNVPLRTVLTQKGSFYDTKLIINSDFFNNLTYDEVEAYVKASKSTVCENINDLVKHEINHADQANNATIALVDKYNDMPGLEGISPVATQDMLESLAEAKVLRDHGLYDTLSEEVRAELDKAAKELNLW